MQLDDLTEERSISTISKKTNLPVSVITNLFNKKFASFNRVQAMGAISIIEREFDINLGVLREECKYYFNENPPKNRSVTVVQPIIEERPIIPKIVMLILLAMIAYGAWYFYSEYYNKKITLSNGINREVLVDTVTKSNDNIDEEKSTQSDTTVEQESNSLNGSRDFIASETNSDVEPQRDEVVPSSESTEALDMKVVEVETNSSQIQDTKKTKELTLVINTPDSAEADTDKSNSVVAEEVIEDKPIESEEASIEKKIITLIPGENMWFRLINLNTKKVREYKRLAEYHIDMREGDWLFAAQNVDFSFKDNDKTAVYGGRGKLFYRLDQKGIHKLNENEYRVLSK